jgi:NADH-quinone oxidoreductase subunit K
MDIQIGLVHYLTVAAVMFGFGLLTVMTRKNAVGILLGVELILNAAALNFIAFQYFVVGDVGGQIFTVFIIVLAASEAAIALAIVLTVYRNIRSIMSDRMTTLKN